MRLETREVNDVLIIDVLGSHSFCENWSQLRDAFAASLEKGKRKILINLDYLKYIDSQKLGALLWCYKAAQDSSAKLALLAVHKRIYDLLVIARPDRGFKVFSDEAKAVKSFGRQKES